MTTLTPLLAADAPSAPDPAHQRAEVRNNMFVVAVLYGAGGSVPVRVRNMSRGGALVESADTPGEGQHVRLSRGSLSVRGHIAWQRDNRAGIRFDTAIDVSDWLPLGARPTGQQRVDEIVQDRRAGRRQRHRHRAFHRPSEDRRDGTDAGQVGIHAGRRGIAG